MCTVAKRFGIFALGFANEHGGFGLEFIEGW